MIYVFGDYALDTHLYELRHGGHPCPLGPQVFNVLAYLIAHRDRVVTKEELIEHLWPAQFVSDATVHQHVTAARKAMGDSGRQQHLIKTLRSRGYRFIASVEVRDDEALGRDGPVSAEAVHPAARQVLHPAEESLSILHGALMAERKLVTVLYGTLANAVTLVERLGLEALPRLHQALLDRVQHEVQPYQGTLQAVGHDSFAVLFGVPVAQEDHARRAVLAGLALQRRLQQPYTDPVTQHEVSFEVCLGVHTGPVMVGSSASDPQQPATVLGEVTHLVARLQQLAAPGMLLGSEDTLQLVRGEVRSAACGSVAIPGRPEPLRACVIQALGPWRASLGWRTGRALSQFVGREREMAVLNALLERAVQGQGHVVGIMGEPGMGKSRLLYEFVQPLASKAVTYVEGQCLSYGSAIPYLPVLDLLRHLCGITDVDGLETLAAKVHGYLGDSEGDLADDAPYLLHLLGVSEDAERLATLSPHALKTRTFAALQQLCLQRSRQQPLVLAVEDLHWVDPTSEEWLASLVECLVSLPLLLLTTYRPGYRPLWMDKSYATQLALTQLTPEASRAVIQSVAQTTPLSDGLRREIVGKAAGNPFFLEELTRSVVAYDDRPATLVIPDTVQAVLAARLDQLPPEDKRLLQTAAVIGHEVPLPLLQAITERPEDALHRGLTHLQAAEFLYETQLFPEREYTFKHALTHEVAYGSLLQERRRALHARIVEAIERLYADRLDEQVDRLAHHALRGEMWAKALTYGRQAGEKALARSAHREAVGSFEQALRALAYLPETCDTHEQAIDLRLALRSALYPSGDAGRILAVLREAEALAEALDDPHRLGQVLLFLSQHFYHGGAYDQAIAAAQRVLAFATAGRDAILHARANYYCGLASEAQSDYRQAIDCFGEIVAALDGTRRYERFGQATLPAAVSRANSAGCHAELGRFAEGRALGEEGLRIAEAAAHPVSLMIALWGMGLLALRRGNLPEALPRLERAVGLCQDADLPFWFPRMAAPLGAAYTLAGRVADALPLLTQALAQATATERIDFQARCRLPLGEMQLVAGHLEEAQTLAEGALSHARAHQEHGHQAYALRLLGDIAAHRTPPEVEAAESHYRQALALAEAIGMRPLQAHCRLGLGTLYAKTGRQEQARAELVAAIALYRAMDMTFWLPQAEGTLAQVS